MASIHILHASDLHIAHHPYLRSPLDKLNDLDDPWDISVRGLWGKIGILNDFFKSLFKEMAASSYSPEILEALCEFIYDNARRKMTEIGQVVSLQENKLDAVLLTGDLATTGKEDDIKRARNFLRATFNPKYPHKSRETSYRGGTLSAVKIPIIHLPGNHDRYVPTRGIYLGKFMRFFNPNGGNYDLLLSNYRQDTVQKSILPRDISQDKKLRVVILTADFTLQDFADHEGHFGWIAQGKVYSDIRKKLVHLTEDEISQKPSKDVLCILWAMHFPPIYPGGKDHSKLLNADKLIEEANRLGVKAILAGHTHQQLNYDNPAIAFKVICCGTTTQCEPRTMAGGPDQHDPLKGNHFQIISITADANDNLNLHTSHYRYDAQKDKFGTNFMSWQNYVPPKN